MTSSPTQDKLNKLIAACDEFMRSAGCTKSYWKNRATRIVAYYEKNGERQECDLGTITFQIFAQAIRQAKK